MTGGEHYEDRPKPVAVPGSSTAFNLSEQYQALVKDKDMLSCYLAGKH